MKYQENDLHATMTSIDTCERKVYDSVNSMHFIGGSFDWNLINKFRDKDTHIITCIPLHQRIVGGIASTFATHSTIWSTVWPAHNKNTAFKFWWSVLVFESTITQFTTPVFQRVDTLYSSHMTLYNIIIIVSDIGLSPVRHQAFTESDIDLKFSSNLKLFHSRKSIWKISCFFWY